VLPAPVVPGAGVLPVVTGELPVERLGLVVVPAKLLGLPAPPHPTMVGIKNEKNRIAPCRIVSPPTVTGNHASSIKGSYGCINSGHIGRMP
jgi:hypothetical protein